MIKCILAPKNRMGSKKPVEIGGHYKLKFIKALFFDGACVDVESADTRTVQTIRLFILLTI